MSFFSVNCLTCGYDRKPIIKEVSFELERGCLMGILGANGSGKTTLLKAICGILPHEGSCFLDDCQIELLSARQIAKLISYIPQRSGISIDISALDTVLMGFNSQLGILEHPNRAMIDSAKKSLETVGLSEKADINYLHLSEGQKQLCILARTLVSKSKLLLLDEPESALDFRYRYRMLNILGTWISETQNSAIVTLHDPSLALNYCDKLLLLSDGNVLGVISPAEDSLEKMEQLLSHLYGTVSLQICKTHTGKSHLVMLKEDDL